jgi:hypothetical protein
LAKLEVREVIEISFLNRHFFSPQYPRAGSIADLLVTKLELGNRLLTFWLPSWSLVTVLRRASRVLLAYGKLEVPN